MLDSFNLSKEYLTQKVTIVGKQPKSELFPALQINEQHFCGMMWAYLDPK
jgi:hypothetical protein